MHYESMIDRETWAFIEATAHEYPDDATQMTVAEQRNVYDRMCRAFFQGYPAGVTASDDEMGGVPVRRYNSGNAARIVIYMHGGGFVVGGLESHDDVCAEICDGTSFEVVSVDYRLAPEHKHPASYDDCLAVTRHIIENTAKPIVLCGDSAGGNLAAAVSHTLRGETDRILGQVLIYPGLGGDMDKGSYITHANAPMLTRDDILYYRDIRLDGPEPRGDPTFAPLQDTDFQNLPPTVIVTAECDPLADDGRDYRDAIRAAGGKAHWVNEPGLVHGYLRARSSVVRARESFDRIVAALSALGAGDWPYEGSASNVQTQRRHHFGAPTQHD